MTTFQKNINYAKINYNKISHFSFNAYFTNKDKEDILTNNLYDDIFYDIYKYFNFDNLDNITKVQAEKELHQFLIFEILILGNNMNDGPQ